MILSLNDLYSIYTKKRDSHGHLKCIKKLKITPRNCCSVVITLCSPKTFWVIWCLSCTVVGMVNSPLVNYNSYHSWWIEIAFRNSWKIPTPPPEGIEAFLTQNWWSCRPKTITNNCKYTSDFSYFRLTCLTCIKWNWNCWTWYCMPLN